MSQVSARRYRPQNFEEVIGQDAIVRTLRNAIGSGRVAHGYIFSGHRGIGKTTVARLLAKALNCRAGDGPTATPCGECDSCREIRDGNAVDVIEIDAASNRGIDEIRALRERVRYQPARDRYKLFILDEAHQLTGDAFNALLKTLEEPPPWAVFVLATTEPEALPATIRSRCQLFGFRAVAFAPLLEHLRMVCGREGIAADEEALGLLAEAGDGSVRDALSLLDQAIAHSGGGLSEETVRVMLGRVSSAQIGELLRAVADDSARRTLELADALLAGGVGPAQLCRQSTQMVRNALVAQSAGADSPILAVPEAERNAAVAVAGWFREEELARFLQILLRTAADLRFGQQQRLHFELGLVKMLHARRLSGVEEVLASLQGGPAPAALPSGGVSTDAQRSAPRAPAPPLEAAAPSERLAAVRVARERPSEPPLPRSPATTTAATADPIAAVAAAAPALDGPAAAAAVLHTLERESRESLAAMLAKAAWQWQGNRLDLVFAGPDAPLVTLCDHPGNRKQLIAACQTALGRSPDLAFIARADAPASAAPPPSAPLAGSAEQRATEHPLLQRLRAAIPSHILHTRNLAQN